MCIVVDVTHFGAVCDGQTDDAPAFQATVDFLVVSLIDNLGRINPPADSSDEPRGH